jgi:type II restriction/modification system DNA methylase subunit YeeA
MTGPVKVGPFDIPGDKARQWLAQPPNANGALNADVVRPLKNASDIVRVPSDRWIVDFGERTENAAAFHAKPFGYVQTAVKPLRDNNRDRQRRERWWQLGRSGADLRSAKEHLARVIATPRVAKHRVFVWLHAAVVPDSRLFILAKDDDATFGIIHSRLHEAWLLATCSWHGVGNDPTYNGESCFETFPFPIGMTPNIAPTAYAADPRAIAIATAAKALVEARDRWLNPPELVDIVPEVVPGFPDRLVPKDAAAAISLKGRTLTGLYNMRGTPEGTWLDNLHRALDEAVAAAYGWPVDITIDDALGRLLALNHARAGAATALS